MYRLLVAALLLVFYFDTSSLLLFQVLQVDHEQLYLLTAITWLSLVIFSTLGRLITGQDFLVETTANYIIDLIAISILAYACGGIESGLVYLTLPTIAMAGLEMPSRLSLLIAATATLGVLMTQIMVSLETLSAENYFFQAGLWGIVLFLASLVFNMARDRMRAAEEQAEKSNRAAQAMRTMNESVIARMQNGVLVVDENGRISLANAASVQLLNNPESPPDSFVGRSIYSIDKLGDRFKEWRENQSLNNQSFSSDYSGVAIEAHFRPLQQMDSTYTLIFLDDTRLVRHRAQQLKIGSLGKLSAGLAHEVRNPLSAISQANEILMQSESLSEEDIKLTEIIDRHCIRMNEIIDVVQQLARRNEPRRITLNLHDFLLDLADEIREIRESAAEINIDVPADLQIQFDPANLKQVLINVVDNALRHSEKMTGKAVAGIRIGSPPESRHLFLDITDEGPGVPRKIVRSIFDPFFTTGSHGSGLGLYVARELCEANYGAIHYVYNDRQTEKGFFRISFWMLEEKIVA